MNVETGTIYRTADAIEAATARGEPVVRVSERVAEAVTIGGAILNRRERRKQAALARRQRKARSKR